MNESGQFKRGIVTGQRVDAAKATRAKELRQNQTPTEQILWEWLKGKRLDGFKFRRQQVINGFIADFYCDEAGVVVEIDGGVHESRQEQDAIKSAVIAARDLLLLRFTNDDVMTSPDTICQRIAEACRNRARRSEHP